MLFVHFTNKVGKGNLSKPSTSEHWLWKLHKTLIFLPSHSSSCRPTRWCAFAIIVSYLLSCSEFCHFVSSCFSPSFVVCNGFIVWKSRNCLLVEIVLLLHCPCASTNACCIFICSLAVSSTTTPECWLVKNNFNTRYTLKRRVCCVVVFCLVCTDFLNKKTTTTCFK